ncbi:DUF5777 family beta-barrel protein [Hymenobacter sp. HDW8]|uniref:DUF5777 family beta-barrel protein n=1 Tax=Hymenobacter sp. HDW8 TaxID=2714932 RepID=UPI001407DD00|nr:DUF5777 family beta-barrel protein [Hymenobacter sp. HDW8]QIL77648.1 hypothetical protein G7064_18740 [Hymenobacter sp. HDW8]
MEEGQMGSGCSRIHPAAKYFYRLPTSRATGLRDAMAAGVDIETGGHVFQLHVTNAQGMIEPLFIPRTGGQFFDGDIYFGFNVARNFTLRPADRFRK